MRFAQQQPTVEILKDVRMNGFRLAGVSIFSKLKEMQQLTNILQQRVTGRGAGEKSSQSCWFNKFWRDIHGSLVVSQYHLPSPRSPIVLQIPQHLPEDRTMIEATVEAFSRADLNATTVVANCSVYAGKKARLKIDLADQQHCRR
ncbi:hypothetical protein TNCT_166171 [Trichonephila clavata]|uniref:Uncharacterized protein n=1 Tax=Trichonephila clavata TaxID=2740835 RepID=A0A8X6GEM4_TRICU|nr:hypothetical protein TNCT_166171 [Trichonephila clavata]